jgi:hypothetical protein
MLQIPMVQSFKNIFKIKVLRCHVLSYSNMCSRTTSDRTKAARLCSLGEKPGMEIRINLAASIDERRRILS